MRNRIARFFSKADKNLLIIIIISQAQPCRLIYIDLVTSISVVLKNTEIQ